MRVDGVPIARFGNATMFSTHATKVFHTIEGGIVAWRDEALMRDLPQLVNFGLDANQDASVVGINARMNDFEAAMGLCNLRHFDDVVCSRCGLALRYEERLEGVEGLRVLRPGSGTTWNYAYLPVLVRCREEVERSLRHQEVFARRYFWPSVDRLSCYAGRFNTPDFPVAHRAADEVLCLPLYDSMDAHEVDRVCDCVLDALG